MPECPVEPDLSTGDRENIINHPDGRQDILRDDIGNRQDHRDLRAEGLERGGKDKAGVNINEEHVLSKF